MEKYWHLDICLKTEDLFLVKNNSFQGYQIGTYSICMVRIIYITLYALCLSIMFEQHFYIRSGTRAPGKQVLHVTEGKDRNSRW
jgi:hypothetical protein